MKYERAPGHSLEGVSFVPQVRLIDDFDSPNTHSASWSRRAVRCGTRLRGCCLSGRILALTFLATVPLAGQIRLFGSTEVAACLESDEEYVVKNIQWAAPWEALCFRFWSPSARCRHGWRQVNLDRRRTGKASRGSRQPVRIFESRNGAAEWFLKLSGLEL